MGISNFFLGLIITIIIISGINIIITTRLLQSSVKALGKFYFFIGPEPNKPFPEWPDDFRWNNAGPLKDYRCVQILENSDPHTWKDNFFCSSKNKKDPGMKWSSAGQISGMKCIQIKEPSDPNTWTDNYLCLPSDSPLNLQWSHAGPIAGKSCIQWSEPSDPHTWNDNYLCGKLHLLVLFFITPT